MPLEIGQTYSGMRFIGKVTAMPMNLGSGFAPAIYVVAGAPGTNFDGEAEPGSWCVDTTNKKKYINTGTKASPSWTVTGAQTS